MCTIFHYVMCLAAQVAVLRKTSVIFLHIFSLFLDYDYKQSVETIIVISLPHLGIQVF